MPTEDVVDEALVAGGVRSLERERLDHLGPEGRQLGRRLLEALGVPAREDDRPGAPGNEPAQDRPGQLRAASEHEDRLGGAQGVVHAALRATVRPSRRARSDCSTPSGSTRSRTAIHSPRRGYMRASRSGRSLPSFAR